MQNENRDNDKQQNGSKGALEKDHRVSPRYGHRLTVARFHHGTQDHCQQERAGLIADLPEDVTEEAEYEHDEELPKSCC